jgi:hypothetical protein
VTGAIGGSLLTRAALQELAIRTAPASGAFTTAYRRWSTALARSCGPATAIRTLADVGLAPLASLLDYAAVALDRSPYGHFTARLHAPGVVVPAIVTEWGTDLDRTWRTAVRSGLASGARWCVIFNGRQLRVVDAARPHARRHLDVQLDLLVDDQPTLGLLAALLGPGALGAGQSLESLVEWSDAQGERVCADLRDGVRDALAAFTAALIAGEPRRLAPLALDGAYEEALTAVYRLLFLFFAEARGLVPSWHPVYRDAYGMEAMRAAAELDIRGLWPTFQAISRLAHTGCRAGDLEVTAFNGRLFAPSRAPRLERRALGQAHVREALLAISTRRASRNQAATRIAFGDLDVEELGAVYEGLLEHAPQIARESPPARGRPLRVRLERTAVARRKETGTFYTPRALTEYLVRETLEPLVRDRSAGAVLELRVVDPAMGSGAFLVAACRYLAEQYEQALVRDGACHATDIDAADRATFRRTVAQRCLFGVDCNPMAVQLARLSLWLTTLAADRPLTFLDHHLAAGHSLVGATLDDLARWPAHGVRRSESRQLPLFDPVDLADAVAAALPMRHALEREPDETAEQVHRKEATLDALGRGDLAAWRSVCDLWCSRWFRPDRLTQPVFETVAAAVLGRPGELPAAQAQRAIEQTRALAGEARFFHWLLEFPEVFCDDHGRRRPDGGFDAVIGNPPWEMLRDDPPLGAGRLSGRASTRPTSGGANGRSAQREQTVRFSRESGTYQSQSSGHANAYQLFVERALWLARDGGRIGLVLPWGLATDQGAAPLRRALLLRNRLEAIVGFDNRRGIFPIHRSMRFMLLTAARGGRTTAIRCRLGLQHPADVEGTTPQRAGQTPTDVRLTPGLIERLSGEDLGIPDVRHPMDIAIAEAAAARWPRLGAPDGWHAVFGRELNASDDRGSFVRGSGLPVLEGKHIAPFRVGVTPSEWHVPRGVALDRLGPRIARARLAFRDVASHTNRTTLIAAIVPAWCVTTHTLFCLRTALPAADQLVLCALLNSYVANFLVRLRVSSHVTTAIAGNLPVPRPAPRSPLHASLLQCARRLALGGTDAIGVEPGAQAHAAEAYGLDRDAFAYVLSTFPLVDAAARDRALDAFTRPRRR